MDELQNMGPVLLPEEEAKLAKQAKRNAKFQKIWVNKKKIVYGGAALFLVVIVSITVIKVKNSIMKPINSSSVKPSDIISKDAQLNQSKTISGLQLSPYADYGNKYANGLLPVGDKKYVTDAPKKGYIYTCNSNFVAEGQAGAQTRGPWFVNNNTQWDIKKKPAVSGSVNWTPVMSNTVNGAKRTISSNGYPNHITGVFPIASSDPAHKYDANPNSIKLQSLSYELSAGPSMTTPSCVQGEVGIMLTGVPLFDAFDAGGRDAGAWEVQDSCDGHPQEAGEYHYHTLSRCIKDTSVRTIIGYALDGFPITGPKVSDTSILTTDNLDECHGIVSEINEDDKKVTTFHYVMTEDFPYSVSCFKAKPISLPHTNGGAPLGAATNGQLTPQGQLPPPKNNAGPANNP